MGVLRKVFYKNHFVRDKFSKQYPFGIMKQPKGYFKSFGEKNPDKIFFVIWRDFLGAGFFSNFLEIARYAEFARGMGMIPIIDFKNFKTLYNEKDPINGTENSWEYYFEQISPYTLDEVYSSKNVFFGDGGHFRGSDVPRLIETKEGYKDFWDKNIHLKESVKTELAKYSDFFNQRILGVHFRGKEMNIAQMHPYGPTTEQMFRCTDEILEKYQIEKVFISTEEKDYSDAFIKRYGDKILLSDAFRIAKVNAYNLNPRPNHRYLLGMDALIDSILLSKCTGLLHGGSGLSRNSERIGNHEFVYTVDNGVNFKKWYLARYSFAIKKLLPSKFGGLRNNIIITERTATS